MQRTQDLPSELVKIIFEQCSQDALKNVSLANKRFRDVAQPILFRKVSVRSASFLPHSVNASKRTEFFRTSPHVVQLIRVVQIWIGSHLKPATDFLALLQHETIQALSLGIAPSVKTTDEFNNLVVKICKSPCLQRLTVLANYPPSLVLASVQPSLKHLKLALQPLEDPSCWARPKRSLPATLDSLGFVWDRPAPRTSFGSVPEWKDVVAQVQHFLEEDRSKVDLRRLKSLLMPIQMGSGIGTGVEGVSECRAILSRCWETLETLSLVMRCTFLKFIPSSMRSSWHCL
jgi:hypothetical protein